MSHRNSPPRQSPLGRGPKVVTTHAGVKSVGTHRSRKHVVGLDWNDPEAKLPNGSPGAGSAPGSSGPPTTGASIGPGGPLGSF
jgi:hypothetical protein